MVEFRSDLAAAGIAEEDERGRKVVLHSLRHSLATLLAASNVPPAIAMKIMRHRDIRLTLQAYTDDGLLPVAAAMATLPSVTALEPAGELKLAAN
jgi:integrase